MDHPAGRRPEDLGRGCSPPALPEGPQRVRCSRPGTRSREYRPDRGQKRTEVVPEVVFLGKLVERVAAGRIRVPRFQRAFVWRQPDLSVLLDSVLRGFPIGSILVWDTEKNIESTSRIGPVGISPRTGGSVGYLLDGQQRVSTLAGTLLLTDDMNPIVDQID